MLGSNVLPAILSLAILPVLVTAYGDKEFGLLMICWSIVGYFNVFDMGMGRAITHILSKKLSEKASAYDIAELVRTTLTVSTYLGIFGGFILWISSDWLIQDILKVNEVSKDFLLLFSLLAVLVPFVILTTVIKSIFEAQHLFKLTSILRTILGISIFLGPYISTYFGANLRNAILSLFFVRFFVFIIHYYILYRSEILRKKTSIFNMRWISEIFEFASWTTLSNAIGPFLDYLDRFFILSIIGAAAVTYYVIPFDVLTRLTFISMSISTVIYPYFSQSNILNEIKLTKLLKQSLFVGPIIIYPFLIVTSFFSHELLSTWMNQLFSIRSAGVVCFLSAGLLVNSYSQIVYAYLQGVGRADLTAKLHLLEVIPYLFFLVFAINSYGILGASISWFIRGLIDLFGMIYILKKINYESYKAVKTSFWCLLITILTMIPIIFLKTTEIRILVFSIYFCIYIFCVLILARKFNLYKIAIEILKLKTIS